MKAATKLRLQKLAGRFRTVGSGILADSPELQLVAKHADIDPARLLRAFNDPEHFSSHITDEEMSRFGDAYGRLVRFINQMPAVIDLALERGWLNKARGQK